MADSTSIGHESQAPPAHGGRREEAARRYGIPKEELLDFSASVNLLGPPRGVAAAIRGAITDIPHYPQEDAADLAGAMACYLGVEPERIVPGNGSIEVIYWLMAALRPGRILIVEPTFSEYRRAGLAAGAACGSFMLSEEEGFALDVERIDPRGYDLVIICNPNNPTGYMVPVEEAAALWRRCRKAGAGLLMDEAFVDFAGDMASVLLSGAVEDLYVVRSFTKSHALAGLRLGCLVSEPRFAGRLGAMMPPWNINAFAAAAGEEALGDIEYLFRARSETAAARSRLYRDLASIPGIDPLPSEANFILCRLHAGNSAEVADRLGRMGILVRDCRSFEGLGERFIRVAVRAERENYQLVSALRKALA